jgi:thiamine-phosphate pyrophosphorylase
MRIDLTPAVDRALVAAARWACRLGSATADPSHLLLGLLDEEDGRAAEFLRTLGLQPTAIRTALAPNPQPIDGLANLADRTRELLGLARNLAVDDEVSGDTVVLSILAHEPSLRRELEALGLIWQPLEAEWTSRQTSLPLDEPLHLVDSTETLQTARILDAAANRAREALRVIEDYCRFALDDAYLCSSWKSLRHALAEILHDLSPDHLLLARDTAGDVGTTISTRAEGERSSLLAVARANCKRLQEALRTLEEFGKLHGPTVGQAIEALRYRSYTLERAVLLGAAARQQLANTRLCVLLTGANCTAALDWTIREAAAGGADLFQLREKDLSDRDLLERARNVRRWTREVGALFIVNDRADIARLVEADGVHLGQDDLPVREAWRIVGPDLLIGVSTHNLDQLRQAILDGASYVGIGPTFPSSTKSFAELAGLDFIRQATAETSLPAFAIGGINPDNITDAITAGARRIAVSHAICQSNNPRALAAALRRGLPE